VIDPAAVPLRVGTEQVAQTIRLGLERVGFTEHVICERLSIPSLEGVGMPLFKSLAPRIAGAGALDALAFLFGDLISSDALGEHLTPEEIEAFFEADLIRRWNDSGSDDNRLYSPVRFVPLSLPHLQSDLWLVGDRGDRPDGSAFAPFADIVFPGQNPLTRHFLKLLPRSPCRTALDLCAGTAVAGLAMAGVAEHCAAGDIAERSVHFARFNRWLNKCDRLELVCGDLYEPVAGRRFDRIVAHPPYVPALTQQLTYRDGGQTGDEIVQRVIAGLPQHLSEGGTFHVLCLAMDTADGLFEERARTWLGDAEREFDIVFAIDSRTPPELIAGRLVDRAGGSQRDFDQWRDLFQGLRVKEFVYGALAGRRFASDRTGEAFTRRVLLTDDCTGEAFESLFRCFDWLRLPDREARVLSLTPRLPPDLHLEVRHRVENNSFVPGAYALTNGGQPFFARLDTEAWVAAMMSEFDGTRTVREVFASAVARARVPSGFDEHDVARMVAFLLERGCLRADG
jgi:hypothetical protein